MGLEVGLRVGLRVGLKVGLRVGLGVGLEVRPRKAQYIHVHIYLIEITFKNSHLRSDL